MCPSQLTTDSHSIRSNWLLIALHQGIGIWEISYILVSMTTDGVNMQALFRKQYCWCFVGTTSNSFMVDVILKKALWSYGFYYISTPLLQCSSNLRQMGSVADVPTGVMPPIGTYSLYLDDLLISVALSHFWHQKFLWWEVRTTTHRWASTSWMQSPKYTCFF